MCSRGFQCYEGRRIDTALCYNTEDQIGRAIKDSGVPRSEIFITSKVASCSGAVQGFNETLAQQVQNLQLLQTTYTDLLLVTNYRRVRLWTTADQRLRFIAHRFTGPDPRTKTSPRTRRVRLLTSMVDGAAVAAPHGAQCSSCWLTGRMGAHLQSVSQTLRRIT